MHFLLDQNISCEVAAWLRLVRPEDNISHVSEIGLTGASDQNIFRWAQSNGAIVITFDEDFADSRLFPLGSHHGIIRLRVWPTTIEKTKEALARLFSLSPPLDLQGNLVIVDINQIRLRKPRILE